MLAAIMIPWFTQLIGKTDWFTQLIGKTEFSRKKTILLNRWVKWFLPNPPLIHKCWANFTQPDFTPYYFTQCSKKNITQPLGKMIFAQPTFDWPMLGKVYPTWLYPVLFTQCCKNNITQPLGKTIFAQPTFDWPMLGKVYPTWLYPVLFYPVF